MQVTKLYVTGEDIRSKKLKAVLDGSDSVYKTQHLHSTIASHPDGIAYIPLMFDEMSGVFKEVTVPISTYMNSNAVAIASSIKSLRESKCVLAKKSEQTPQEKAYYGLTETLNKRVLEEGKVDESIRIAEQEYRLRSLSFSELMENMYFPFFIVVETLERPSTQRDIARKTGFKEDSISMALNALRYVGLLNSYGKNGQNKTYSLSNDYVKLDAIARRGIKLKAERVSRMRDYVSLNVTFENLVKKDEKLPDKDKVLPRLENLQQVAQLAGANGLTETTVRQWLFTEMKPKMSQSVAQTLSSQGFIMPEELEVFDGFGLIKKS
jgi:hypothetical protein